MDFFGTMTIASSGLNSQGSRLKVIAENMANAQSTGTSPGAEPYRRKLITFRSVLDRATGTTTVAPGNVTTAGGDFERRYDPTHPAADKDGYIMLPNVNPLMEMMDMREAQQSYQANLNVVDAAKSMLSRTIDLLRS
jgi:flagellar basal-body rod protein FlgC